MLETLVDVELLKLEKMVFSIFTLATKEAEMADAKLEEMSVKVLPLNINSPKK